MTFILTSRRQDTTGQETDGGRRVVRVLTTFDAASRARPDTYYDQLDEAGEEARTLTASEIARLECEGRIAAFQSLSIRSCPYNTASRAEREAWMTGYNTLK